MKKIMIVVMILLITSIIGCTPKSKDYVLNDFIVIMDNDKDYKEFVESRRNKFDPILVNSSVMTNEFIDFKKNDWMIKGQNYGILFDNINKYENLYYIEIKNRNNENEGLIAVLDMKNKSIVKWFAILTFQQQ